MGRTSSLLCTLGITHDESDLVAQSTSYQGYTGGTQPMEQFT